VSEDPKPRCTDQQLDQITNTGADVWVRAAAAELIARRARDRHDSRMAEQLKKMRWNAELILVKLEALEARYRAEGLPPMEPGS